MKQIDTLKEIILDQQEQKLQTGVKRHISLQYLPNKATIAIGVRRCGKSTLLSQIIEEKLTHGIDPENILCLNFFDDRLTEIRNNQLNLVLEAYYSLYPLKKAEKIYCFFDELQECTGWEPFIDRILRTENAEVYITGSSAKMLSTEIATQMRGRSLIWELFPFSFKEFLDYHEAPYSKLSSENRYRIKNLFEKYISTGGFPEVVPAENNTRIMIHQEYYKAIVHRDIIERFDAIHPKAVMQAAYRLITSVSNLYSVNRITEYLKSLGYKLSKEFVANCIEWFEDAYFLFSVKIHDKSVVKQNANTKKVYCVDHGLITSIWPGISENKGHLLENMVFCHIRRGSQRIFYYRTKQGNEVDFLWYDDRGKKELVQVCWDMTDEKNRKREIKSLKQAMSETGLKKGTIVTYVQEELIEEDNLIINVVPGWKYFLS